MSLERRLIMIESSLRKMIRMLNEDNEIKTAKGVNDNPNNLNDMRSELKQLGMEELIKLLQNMTDKQKQVLKTGFGAGKNSGDVKYSNKALRCSILIPTQNEIDIDNSLAYPLKKDQSSIPEIMEGGPISIANQPIIVYKYGDRYYIIDGHHRWSQCYLLNPNCKINAIVFSEVPKDRSGNEQKPLDVLRDFQGAIAATGKVTTQNVEKGNNIFEKSPKEIENWVKKNATEDAVKAMANTGYVTDLDSMAEMIKDNSVRMQKKNQPVTGAPSRSLMPQTDKKSITAAEEGMTDI